MQFYKFEAAPENQQDLTKKRMNVARFKKEIKKRIIPQKNADPIMILRCIDFLKKEREPSTKNNGSKTSLKQETKDTIGQHKEMMIKHPSIDGREGLNEMIEV